MKKPHRALRDIFNSTKLRRAFLAVAGTAALVSSPIVLADQWPKTTPVVVPCEEPARVPARPAIPYDELLFQQNDAVPSDLLKSMTEKERLQFYMNRFCFTADQRANDNNPDRAHLVTALDTLSALTYMGRPLIDLAVDSKLHFCALPHLPAGTAAQYMAGYDFVAATRNAAPQGEVLDLAHEITHAAQGRQGLLNYSYYWDIESRVRRNLVDEAAPVAMEYAVAYEKKLNGDDSYWTYLKAHTASSAYTDPANHLAFETAYNAGIASGKTQADALRDGAHVVFERVFNSPEWRNFYLNSELNSYLSDLADGKFRQFPTIQRNGFDDNDVANASKVGDLPGFTAGAEVPSYAQLLNHDQKMAWAYEAVDLARLRQSLGADAPEVQQLAAKAAADKNPYLTLDLAEVSRRAEAAKWDTGLQYTYRIMDKMLTEPAPVPKICFAAPPKPAA
ncbi:MAG: hypothetical protein PW788_07780 [Micavibrio sp.]|nr:hypothetical protein [Micavibrio sp.]